MTKNLWHSCVNVAMSSHFEGKPAARRETWERWLAAARECGPVEAYAQKTRIVIQHRVRFAGAIVRLSYLDACLWLRGRTEHPRLRTVEHLPPYGYVHRFRLEHPDDIDPALRRLMKEAYVTTL